MVDSFILSIPDSELQNMDPAAFEAAVVQAHAIASGEEKTRSQISNRYLRHWLGNPQLHPHEHLSCVAKPDNPDHSSEPPSICKNETKKKSNPRANKRAKEPHLPPWVNDIECPELAAFLKANRSDYKPAPLTCRCDACVGYRVRTFVLELRAYSHNLHVRHKCTDGTCGFFCPNGPNTLFKPNALTLEIMEKAAELGFKLDAVLTGKGIDPTDSANELFGKQSYGPEGWERGEGEPHEVGGDVLLEIDSYRRVRVEHSADCAPEKPCRGTLCFKRADELAEHEIAYAKDRLPHWQQRMMFSPGLAELTHKEMLERREKKKEKDKKMAKLSKGKGRWSEAPEELIEYLGVSPKIHLPICCPQFPCVSKEVCFPADREGGLGGPK